LKRKIPHTGDKESLDRSDSSTERPGTDHVILGPMKGLENKSYWKGTDRLEEEAVKGGGIFAGCGGS
jgi:hypothetical protein